MSYGDKLMVFVPTSVWNQPEEGANQTFWSKVPVLYEIEIHPSKG